MKNVKLSKLWDALHSSYWFIPTVMAVGATALAFTMLTLDRSGKAGIDYSWSYTGGADGARSLLGFDTKFHQNIGEHNIKNYNVYSDIVNDKVGSIKDVLN